MPEQDSTLVKIAKLLRLAESTKNEAEADAYLTKAQAIATQSAIDLEVARGLNIKNTRKPVLITSTIRIGDRGKKGLANYVRLFSTIAGNNNVKINIAHNSTYVVAFGFDTDIEVVEAIYTSLVVQMVSSSDAYLKSGEYKKDSEWVPAHKKPVRRKDSWGYVYTDYEYVPGRYKAVDGRIARNSFQLAFISKISHRLREARKAAETAASEAAKASDQINGFDGSEGTSGASNDSVALVLVRKQEAVNEHYTKNSDARGSWKGGRSSGYSGAAASAGTAAGARARIGASTAIGGSRKALV